MPTETWDRHSNQRILKLHPKVRADAVAFINSVEERAGIRLRVTDGFRTFEEQDALYAKGRFGNTEEKVTDAKAGESYHNYGLAIDVCEIRDGAATWACDWDTIVPIAKELGWEWGGDWTSFKDRPHFQKTYGKSVGDLLMLYNNRANSSDFVEIT